MGLLLILIIVIPIAGFALGVAMSIKLFLEGQPFYGIFSLGVSLIGIYVLIDMFLLMSQL